MKYLITLPFVLCCLTLKASIIYTDIVDQIVGPDNTSIDLDFNQDNTPDATINYNDLDVAIAVYDLENDPLDAAFISTVVIGSFLEIPLNQITPLNLEDPISPDQNYIQPSSGGINNLFANFNMESINFPTGQDYYLGARFYVNGELHYGWVRVEMQDDGASMEFKDYAYNDLPGEGLTAGQLPIVDNITDQQAALDLNLFPNPAKNILNIQLGNTNFKGYSYSIVSLLGEEIQTNSLTGLNTQLDLSSLIQGVYILKIYNQHQSSSRKFVKRD